MKTKRTRPDVSLRNKTNNPIWNHDSKLKMIKGLTGKKQSKETKEKRRNSLVRFYKEHPEVKNKIINNLHRKYTDKIRGTGWRIIRAKYLVDNPNCALCGNPGNEVHHINNKGRSLGTRSGKLMDNRTENLQTLCKRCHSSISSKHRWAKVRGEK